MHAFVCVDDSRRGGLKAVEGQVPCVLHPCTLSVHTAPALQQWLRTALAAAGSFLVPRQRQRGSGTLTQAPPGVSEELRSVAFCPSPPPPNHSGRRSPPPSAGAAAGFRRAHARAHAGVPLPPTSLPRAAWASARAQPVPAAARTDEAGNPAGAGRWRRLRPGEELPGVGALQVRGRRRSAHAWATLVGSECHSARGRDLSPPPGAGRGGGWGARSPVTDLVPVVCPGRFSRGEHRVCR